MNDLNQFAYRPYIILDGVFEIPNNDTTNKVSDEELEEAERRVNFASLYLFFFCVLTCVSFRPLYCKNLLSYWLKPFFIFK